MTYIDDRWEWAEEGNNRNHSVVTKHLFCETHDAINSESSARSPDESPNLYIVVNSGPSPRLITSVQTPIRSGSGRWPQISTISATIIDLLLNRIGYSGSYEPITSRRYFGGESTTRRAIVRTWLRNPPKSIALHSKFWRF